MLGMIQTTYGMLPSFHHPAIAFSEPVPVLLWLLRFLYLINQTPFEEV
jgi:hypothetical protein